LPAWQSLLSVQLVLHAVPMHVYVAQSPLLEVHDPALLHAPMCVTVESDAPSVHVSAPHFVVGPG
jgi:hypothetical protein